MANPEHVKILKQGLHRWNEWRKEHRTVRPDMYRMDLSYRNLTGADFTGADLSGALLTGADLAGATLRYADLAGATLRRANLTGAYLSEDLDEASSHIDLAGTDLTGAKLTGADLTGADLDDANFTRATWGQTMLGDNDLSRAKGLETGIHAGPSFISIDTLYKSRGNIPEVFLQGCGVPEDFIIYARSLTTKAIDFYSCFISYSSKDQGFAERLHADLQSKGVRCWFAPEDLQIGDRFRDRIDESIRLHDKLLLILSENSVSSQWVGDEVEAAFEREQKESRTVLFPIRIDDAVLDSDKAWAAKIRRTCHVGDFTRWKGHDSYSKAFERLLRDLKTGA